MLNEICLSDFYFDITDNIIVVISKDEAVIEINRKGCEILGYRREEIIGKNWFDKFLSEKFRNELRPGFHRLLEGTEVLKQYENPVLTSDGSERIVAWHNILLRDKADNIIGALSSGEDVTERRREAAELSYLSSFPKLNPNPVVEADAAGHLRFINRAAQALFPDLKELGSRHPFLMDWAAVTDKTRNDNLVMRQINIGNSWYQQTILCLPGFEYYRIYSIDITELKRSEERFRALVTASSVVLYVMSPDWSEMRELHSRSFSQEAGKSSGTWLEKYIDPADQPKVSAAIEEAIRNKSVFELAHRVRRKDGSPGWTFSRAIPLLDANGEIMEWFGSDTDITERKQEEEAMIASEMRYRRLFETAQDGILILDFDTGKVVDVNPFLLKLLGYTFDEFMGKELWEIGLFKDIASSREAFELLQNKGYIRYEDLPLENSDGQRIDVEFVSNVYRVNNTRVIQCNIRNITERKSAEQALKESEKKFGILFETMSEGFSVDELILDDSGKPLDLRYLMVNHAFELQTGLKAVDVVGHTMLELFPQVEPIWFERFGNVASTGEPAHFEVRFGPLRRWFDVRAYRIEPGRFAVVSFDITDRKLAEEKLLHKTEELEEVNKELQQFAYVTSHDLREPLRMITGFTQSLEKRYKDKLDKTANEYIDFIVDGTARMQNLIDDILSYSRIATYNLPFEAVNMERVLKDVLSNLKVALEETDARITHDPLPVIHGDPVQMMQVLQNLVSNAIKFHREGEAPVIRVSARREGNEYIFSVKDNGIGIDPQLFGRLFALFQRLNTGDKYPGTGVGLAVTKRIIGRHGGKIWVESLPGKGASFYFTIPEKIKREKDDRL